MSRKREKQRDNKRELARQLGVGAADLDDDVREELLSHGRVCEPALRPVLSVKQLKRGFLKAPAPLSLHLALYIVDAGGARCVRLLSLRGVARKIPGEVVLSSSIEEGEEKVRYTRPGHFVIGALVTEGPDDKTATGHARALAQAASVRIEAQGQARAVDDPAWARQDKPMAARFLAHGAAIGGGEPAIVGGAVLGVAAVHRVKETVQIPLASADGKLEATLVLDLRL